MAIEIRQFPVLSDNYAFLVRDQGSGLVATLDTPDADAIAREVEASGWGRLDFILNTHWHPDHAGGNAALKARFGCEITGPAEVERIAPLDRMVAGGETVGFGETTLKVMPTPGHTLGHIVYWSEADAVAFVGDTLFAMGCGRLFEGTADQMWASLQSLAGLPDQTTVYCAHEYTASNARFALSVDPDPAVKARAEAVLAARERGEPTVPTTIALERATNPFLRAPSLVSAATPAEAFGQVRAAKDGFKG